MKYRNPFIPFVIIWVIIFTIVATAPIFAQTKSPKKKTDLQIVREYCRENYPKYTIKIVKKYNPKIMENRKGKNIVYVEKEISFSSGKKDKQNGMYWGYIKGSNYYKTWYNSKVKKEKKVISYYIYNPHTNYSDDIVAVIDNNKLR